MQLNAKKCKAMHIGKKNIDYEYSMNGVVLESVEAEKDLGVMISHDLKTFNQCVRQWELMIVNEHSDMMVKLYKSLVRPHVVYNCLVTLPGKIQGTNWKNTTSVY